MLRLSFRVRADKPARLHSSVSMDRDPWRVLGMRSGIDVTTEWKTFTYKFIGTENFDNAHFNFTGMKTGTFEFADFTLRTCGKTVKCFALDSSGKRKEQTAVVSSGPSVAVVLGPQHKTLWYEIVQE